MQPCFIVIVNSQEHDYTHYVDGEGMQIEKNDIDAEGAGRNILDGKMYRNRLAQKYKVTVKFLPLPSSVVSALSADLSADEFVDIKILDPETASSPWKCINPRSSTGYSDTTAAHRTPDTTGARSP